jgi:hypothetical protein
MNKKSKKMLGTLAALAVIVSIVMVSVSAEEGFYAENPSIQNSKYYMLEFSIESNAEIVFLILDGESHEMFKENGNYVYRTSFEEGDHEYYFELDGKRFPKDGSYKVTEVERRWILLNSLIDHLTWKPNKEQTLLTKKQELYQILSIKSATLVCISGLTKRMGINSMKTPQNFDTSQIVKSLKATDLGKERTFDITKSPELLDLSQASYTFALEVAEGLETVSTELDNNERVTIHEIEELARNYGYKPESILKQEEAEGYSVARVYTLGGVHPSIDLEWEGNHYYTKVDAYWGKLHWYMMDYDFWAYAYVDRPYGGDGLVDAIGIWSSTISGRPVFPADYLGQNNTIYVDRHREGVWIDFIPPRNFLTTVEVTGEFIDAQELSTTLHLNLDFAMGY